MSYDKIKSPKFMSSLSLQVNRNDLYSLCPNEVLQTNAFVNEIK